MGVSEQHRIGWIDSLRGFAILLVIVGHLIQYNYQAGIENCLFNIIYSFHMPLFFFISGLCTVYTKQIFSSMDLCKYSYKKFIQLIVPSICWTVLVPLFFVQYLPESISSQYISSYWFLNTLFVVYMVWGGYSYLYIKVRLKPLVVCASIICLIVMFVLGIKRISLMYLILFVLGHYYQTINIDILHNRYLLSVL